ncbi:SDR family NAD(P)-dependent oxidoreductase [Microcella daejeonensis]|uniref:SDR family NAD(P)-dependent oxidoreductase n=1 Tax=Microcella daejeonensis TaxID=2994971 RepID=A0A9E8SAF0_9MICO|nr:SDR family oxidoreductase [Microcella daejeonensis]WAB82521.1 SDR family NAD(P)-dependent oxidoreductase [Microcella daejeonensis]
MTREGTATVAPADRIAVVTGTASGIGRSIALELRSTGWRVAGIDLRDSPDCDLGLIADVTDADAVAAAVAAVESQLGPITGAVSAAGYYEATPVDAVTDAQWRRMLRVHLGGFLHLTRATLPGMLARESGAIVAITSELAVGGGGPGDAHYSAAKGALQGMMRSLAVEVAPRGVRVNAVAPGPTDTPLLAADSPWRAPEYLQTLPTGRLTRPEEVALCAAYLLDAGTFCVGETLHPNSGAVI